MAHFAKIENGIVTDVRVGVIELGDNEAAHAALWGGEWKRTSYNTHGDTHKLGGAAFRKNYAGKGYAYSRDLDGFIPPNDNPSWALNEKTCLWGPPAEDVKLLR